MPGVTPWKLGKHLTSCSIVTQTVAADGTFSDGTTYNVLARVEEIAHSTEVEFEDIGPVTSTRLNNVPIRSGNRVRLTVIKKSDAGESIHAIVTGASHVKMTWIEGTETFGPGYFAVGNFEGGIRGRGKQTVSLELAPCDPNTAQMTYATT